MTYYIYKCKEVRLIKRYECVYQECENDCAVAALLTIIKTYGGRVSKEYLRVLTNTSKTGTNAYYILEAAKYLGFDTRALTGNVKNLKKTMLPCIAHVILESKYKHFVVIHSIGNNRIVIADPSKGILKMSIEEFQKISTSNYLILIPKKQLPYIKDDKTLIINIKEYIYKNKKIIISILFFSIVYTFINILTSYGFQFVIEDSINIQSKNNLYFIIILLLVLSFMKHLTDFVRFNLFNYINHKLDFLLTIDVFKHLLSLPYQYYKTRTRGDIISRINDLSNIRQSLSNVFMCIFVDGLLVVFMFISLLKINKYLSVLSLIVIVLYYFVIKTFSYPNSINLLESKKSASSINNDFIETLTSIDTIKNLKLEEEFKDKINDSYVNYLRKSFNFNKTINIEILFKNLIDSFGKYFILFLGSIFVLKEEMTLTQLITYNSLIIYFLEPIKNIINLDVDIKNMKISIKRIIELYNVGKEFNEIDEKYTNKELIGNIKINDLNYSYNGRNKVLNKVNLDIKSGEKIFICGNSGSGKSTLVKILMKYLNVENEKVLLDDKDINNYNILEIRRDICYVSQNESLFTDSIYNNIILNRNIDYDSFLSICKKLGIDKIANKNINGYNMTLEENGFNLSGGERQRIIMARALLKNSSIYIFDESLSQIDIESERNILGKIFKLYSNKTIIMISHRFDNQDLFDKSYKLEGGVLYN